MTVNQQEFTAALLNPDQPPPKGLVDSSGRPAGKRFDVYRNNVVFSLLEAMRTAFPVIEKMLGPKFFNAVCGDFVRKHPPRLPILMFYGANFPEFLAAVEPLKKFPFLPDVARLELARRLAYHAADADPINPETLGEIDPEQLMQAHFQFVPALQILASTHPIIDLWNFNMVDGAPQPVSDGQIALISRPAFDPEITKIDPDMALFLNLLIDRQNLSSALDTTTNTYPEFDFSAALGIMLQTEIITRIDL